MRRLFPALAVLALTLGLSGPALGTRITPTDFQQLLEEQEALLQYDLGGPVASHSDTVWFGGGGTGNGSIVRGGKWTFEADSGETPEFFLDGDPVGNQYRDGWTFQDRTARNGPSQDGAGHWKIDGTYDFNFDGGSFAHRATTHANNGINDGPDPLSEPGHGISNWSVWIGTNLELNPEGCGWGQTRGYSDGWSQGIKKVYAIGAGNLGAQYDIRFFHRYAVEAGFDTNWVEVSTDAEGRFWDQVGTADFPNGIYNDGDINNPKPVAAGSAEVVNLITWPSNNAGSLSVRFRLSSDGFLSDNNEGGNLMWAWQLDNIALLRNGVPAETEATFESGMNGWQPTSFEGFDFDTTTELMRPAGRILDVSTLSCPPILDCPEVCGIEHNVLVFVDKDDCDINDAFQHSFAHSKAFAIGGPTEPDLDGDEGRLIRADCYFDGGAGYFEAGPALNFLYYPLNAEHCPFTPAGGHPGAGTTFNWAQDDFQSFRWFSFGNGPQCRQEFTVNVSANLPADADSVIFFVGALSQCRHEATCDINDNGGPVWDNVRFGVFNPAGSPLVAARYHDEFPVANGNLNTVTARSDGSHCFCYNLGIENPLRFVRADTVEVETGQSNAAIYMRWRANLGPCPGSMNGHPFFAPANFPPGVWHSARLDTARSQGYGVNSPGSYMTCFHESDPREGTHWDGAPPAVEPCDDILPDGAFKAGAKVEYFFEIRNATTGQLLGTTPAGRNGQPIGTTENYKTFWLEWEVLPKPVGPACNGSEYANNLLVVNRFVNNDHRARLDAVLTTLGLEYDTYDQFGNQYGGIGRREDRVTQAPRPPNNGATQLQLEPYDCIWWYSRTLNAGTLSDKTSLPFFGGHPSQDQQSLEAWIEGCQPGNNRLLILEGMGWGSDIDVNTTHGPAFLSRFGVDVLAGDYAQQLAANDLRRCARVVGQGASYSDLDGEVIFSGCPDNVPVNVFGAIPPGEAVMNFVESLEGGNDPVNCADDENRPAWHAVIRKTDPGETCERSVAMSFGFTYLYPLNCTDQCVFDDFRINGGSGGASASPGGANLVIRLFQWAGQAINPNPIGIEDPAQAPRFANRLYQAQPNPANPSATIRYTIAQKGHVSLKIFDVSGHLVRTLVDEVMEPAADGFEAVWDGTNDGGQRVGSGVFFYQIDAPGFTSSKKLVILK